ncbi:MAG: outer membrane protein assembly factor BamA [Wigglesworthia glossinidia]|nr:outer membrane protein assembly factor BamA [Wigglesworthia glossinidia]
MFTKYFYLIILIFFKLSIATANSKNQFLVKKIVFQGLNNVQEEHMLINLPIKVGEIATEEKISKLIKILFATKLFQTIKVLQDDETLIIKIEECPIIRNITFSGNFSLNKDFLKSLLKDKNINIGSTLYPSSIFEIKKILNNFYLFLGKDNTRININTYFLKEKLVELNINITESKNIFIKKVDIFGNKKFKKQQLVKNIELCEQNFISKLFQPCIYGKHQITQSQKKLYNFYLNQGYIDFHIKSTEVNITSDNKFAEITFNIYEGNIFKISKIIFLENIIKTSTNINKLKQSIINKTYNIQNIIKLENTIKKFLETHGYNNPKIFLEIHKNYFDYTVQIFIHVDFGKCLYVNRIYFSGYESTQEIVFRRELKQLEGDVLKISNIQNDIKKINNLKYAEVIDIKIEDVSNMHNRVNIYYIIKEHKIGKIDFGMGFGVKNKIQFHLGIKKSNLFDNGSFFQMYSEKNFYQTYFELFFLYPYININGLYAKSKIFFKKTKKSSQYEFENNFYRYGTDFFISFPEYKNKSLDFGLEYLHNYTIMQNRYFKENNHEKTYLTTNDIFFIINWNYNTINTEIFPKLGKSNNISGKLTLPWSSNKYYQIFLNSKYFTPVFNNNNIVLMIRNHLGYTNGIQNKPVPFYDKFYTGGFETIRGFYYHTVGPKFFNSNCKSDIKCINNINFHPNTLGGNILAVTNIELIFPINFLIKKYYDVMRISVFLDSGTTWETTGKNNVLIKDNIHYNISNKVRISSGIFLKWFSSFGPISLSYAIPIQKHTYDHIESIQFNIGKTW